MKPLLAIVLLVVATLVQASEPVELWRCPGNVYADRPCAGGRLLSIDPGANLLAAETRRPVAPIADTSGPSVLMIRRPVPHVFEGATPPHPGFVFGPPTVNVRLVR